MKRLRTDYCVVGAGFAGLAAAWRLRDCGKSVTLVEARDRVGGRAWNRTAADGTVVSVGGTWLGKRQDRMFELCRELGVESYPQYDRGDTVMHLDGRNRRYRGNPKVDLFALASLGLAFWQLDRMVKRLPIDEPWKASGARKLDSQTLGAWFDSRWNVPSATARKLIRTTMTTLFCVDPNEVSLLGSLVARGIHSRKQVEEDMPTFILSLNWTDQGIRGVKDAPKRSQAAKELAKKLGVEVKQVYLTSGEHDLLIIVESATGDNVAKFALATGALGNVRTTTARAWPETEFQKLISELP
jgi:uncharacterized protein with GYD domain